MRETALSISCLLAVLLLAGSAASIPARRESLLGWDDWESYVLEPFVGLEGERICVFYQAPPWARSVAGFLVFIGNDGVDAVPPDLWTTESFHAYVWGVAAGEPCPSEPACHGADSGSDYPEDEMLEVRFPEPVSIEDAAVFPDKQFFVGLEWLRDGSPVLLAGAPALPVLKTWEYASWDWSLCLDRNVMMRAIVTDAAGTPVEGASWAGVKAMFR